MKPQMLFCLLSIYLENKVYMNDEYWSELVKQGYVTATGYDSLAVTEKGQKLIDKVSS